MMRRVCLTISLALLLCLQSASLAADFEQDIVPEGWLPLDYIQSGFVLGHPHGARYTAYEQKLARARCISYLFDATEVLNGDIETVEGLLEVRDLNRALRTVSEEREQPFLGFWSFPRLPGFFQEDDLAQQPESYRSYGLKADGSLWKRFPPYPTDIESLIKFTGEALDITNEAAVEELHANIRQTFQWDGPPEQSVGPLFGFMVLNEIMLTGNYESVWSEDPRKRDVASPDAVMRLEGKTHSALQSDADIYYSYYKPAQARHPALLAGRRGILRRLCRRAGA